MRKRCVLPMALSLLMLSVAASGAETNAPRAGHVRPPLVVESGTPGADVHLNTEALPITELARTMRTHYIEVVVQGDLAFAAVAEAMEMFDIEDPLSPVSLAVVPIPGDWTRGVAVFGNYAYCVSGPSGAASLYALDVSDPSNPSVVWSELCGVWPVAADIEGDHLYIADRGFGLRVYNLSMPAAPVLVGELAVATAPLDLDVRGDLSYIAVAPGGLQIVSVADPQSPVAVGSFSPSGSGYGIMVADSVAYLASDNFGVYIVGIADPSNPYQLSQYQTPGYARQTVLRDSLLYVADAGRGVRIVNVKNPASPVELGQVDTPGETFDLTLVGQTLYAADREGGIAVADVTDPSSPALRKVVGEAGAPGKAVFDGRYAFVACGIGGLKIVDLQDRLAPVVVARVPLGCETAASVLLQDTLLFAGSYTGGISEGCLDIINVKSPQNPLVVGSAPAGVYIGDMSRREQYLLVADGNLSVYDVSDPAVPVRVGGYDLWYSSVLLLHGDYAYTDEGVFDISDPTAPVYLMPGSWGLTTTGFAVVGNFLYRTAYFSEGFDGYIYVYDIANPASPVTVASLYVPQEAHWISILGNSALVGLSNRVMELDITTPEAPDTVGTCWPYPLARPGSDGGLLVGGSGLYGGGYLAVLRMGDVACGDVNGDGYAGNVADLTSLVSFLFRGGSEPPSLWAADVTGDSRVNVADITFLVGYLFKGGPVSACS